MGRLINQNSSYNDRIVVGRRYQYGLIGQLTDINSQACVDGSGAALVGPAVSICQGADGSTTGSLGGSFGGGGVTGKACQAFTYCR